MKTYVWITGVIFGLLALVHVWRIFLEGAHLMTDPGYMLLTALSAALCVWAFWLVMRRGLTNKRN